MGWINREKCEKHMRIDIGAGNPEDGENQEVGFVLQDISEYKNIDLVCDIRDLPKYIPEGYCAEVRASHILEHFGTKETQEIIKMVHSLLEEGGIFHIIVPNFKWHAKLVLDGDDETGVYYAFGGQKDEYDFHKTGYTIKILRKYLEENGFRITALKDDSSIDCYAVRI